MVLFDQLRISDDGTKLYINAHVNTADYFSNVYIKKLTIMSADKVSETNPGSPTSDYLYQETFANNTKEIALVLTASDFIKTWESSVASMTFTQAEMSKTLFFVYIECSGAADECVPCPLSESTVLGVTFDENLLYQRVMNYTKALADDCKLPIGFTDFILQWNAFKAAIETEHYVPAIKFYRMLFEEGYKGNTIAKRCNCNG